MNTSLSATISTAKEVSGNIKDEPRINKAVKLPVSKAAREAWDVVFGHADMLALINCVWLISA